MPKFCCNKDYISKVDTNDKKRIDTTNTKCPTTVNETVCIQADVTIKPNVEVGEIKSFCVGSAVIGECEGEVSPTEECTFTVSQKICVEVPLVFSATAKAEPSGIVCGEPEVGSCVNTEGCTLTIGFFRNNPKITHELIQKAEGAIVLGIEGQGASISATVDNAIDILSLNTPSPPAPETAPLAPQYQILYAQLLAANLNVLNSATCPEGLQRIEDANQFIEESIAGVGKEGAPDVQVPLAQFNEGKAPNCPPHCF